MQTVIIEIDEDGNVTIEVDGVVGSSCVDITAALEKALGGKVERRLKDSFHEEDTPNIPLRIGARR